jgi:hypothetical protein
MRLAGAAAAVVFILCALSVCVCPVAAAQDEPRPPCNGADVRPAYAPPGAPPAVGVWSKEAAARWKPPACVGWPSSQRYSLIVALAGQFRHEGDAEKLLARFGAVSTMCGLRYWSETDKDWRVLINDAAALKGPDVNQRRPDFNPGELKDGAELYFAQDDTRSSGIVLYRMRVLERRPHRIVIETVNVGRVRSLFVTLFPPGSLRAIYFLERRESGVWSFYGLSGTGQEASALAGGHEASYVNRAVALYRFLVGISGDAERPAAR